MAEEKKVYCAGCKHYRTFDYCMHPNNMCIRDTYLHVDEVCNAPPSELNQFNDCEWFTPKWWGAVHLEGVISGWRKRLFAERSK